MPDFLKAKKHLGQNFLIDENVLKKISDEIVVKNNDLIIEIGPGKGALTKYLKAKGAYLICYEIDTDLKPYLNIFLDDKAEIIYNDILKSNIKNDIKDINYDNLYIVGNLPYYITTPIIKYIINENLKIKKMVFMVQEEVADRFSANPGSKNYSSITLYLKYFYDIEKLFDVSKYSFRPTPKVKSSVISFIERKNKPKVEQEKYFKVINDSFHAKRKTLKNNLSNYDFNEIKKVLDKYNLSDSIRAEELKEEVFVDITNSI